MKPLEKLDNEIARDFLNYKQEVLLFWHLYKFCPRVLELSFYEENYIPFRKFVNILKNEYDRDLFNNYNDVVGYKFDYEANKVLIENQVVNLADGVLMKFDYCKSCREDVNDYNGDIMVEKDDSEELSHKVYDKYFLCKVKILFLASKLRFAEEFAGKMRHKRVFNRSAKLQMVFGGGYEGLHLNEIEIKRPTIRDLALSYGKDFQAKHDVIHKALIEPESTGIVMLHGLPGTGKTHYIRYLINAISEERNLIYIPPDMASIITTPEFLPFMLRQRNSILIIEDAENIIRSREDSETSNQAVANLLNISDGLLGDSLRQPIIATFNCEINSIDPALLRKGRLIAHHEFGKLDIENAQALSDQLGFKSVITEPMTLADIYGQES